MKHKFLLIGKSDDTSWPNLLEDALISLGKLRIATEKEARRAFFEDDYDMIIIDAGAIDDLEGLTSRIRAQRPEVRVVVVTEAPEWEYARDALQAGAADYLRKSRDVKELKANIEAVLRYPAPRRPYYI